MIDIVLYQPEIPPNTGNIIRLCANTYSNLHIIMPIPFDINTKSLRRAGLDYHDLTNVHTYEDWDNFHKKHNSIQMVAFTTKAKVDFNEINFSYKSFLIFGPETRGLPENILDNENIEKARIPMQDNSRSLNLSNSVAIGLYEALRQNDYRQLST